MYRCDRLPTAGIVLAAALAIAAAAPARAADTYALDKGHTEVRFEYLHLGISKQSGEFDEVTGTLVFDKQDVARSKLDVEVDVASISTGVPALDKHLRSKDFFEVETHPKMTFKSTGIVRTGVDEGRVTGDLTMKGITKPVTLDVSFNFEGTHPLSPYIKHYKDAHYVGFSARGSLLRSDWGIKFAAPLTSDRIDLVLEVELRRQ